MRKLKRAVARATMERKGFKHINKPRHDIYGRVIPSIFAAEWRDNVTVMPEINRKAAKQREKNETKR